MTASVSVFGEVRVHDEAGAPADPGGPKARLLLALLVSRANSVVHADALVDALWGGRPPRTARKNLHVYVSRLRRLFGGRLARAHGGYVLRLGPAECDLVRFEQLARTGREYARAGAADAAAAAYGEAVGLWRGRPLAEFGDPPCLRAAVDRLEEVFLAALEEWAALEGARGGHAAVRDRLQEHVAAHPLRERLAAEWMRTLAATGSHGEAVAYYDTVRHALARELGVAPGRALADLHARLVKDPAGAGPHARPGNQLPRDLPDFVGRAVEVQRALGYLGAVRGTAPVLVVSGPVGAGKSAFAVHVAHLAARSFPDGMVLVEAGGRPLAAQVASLLDAVGLPPEGNAERALARWRRWVGDRRLLLVLDDVAGSHQVQPLLPGCGGSATLVTSRYRLSALEAVARVELAPLGEEEGLELLGAVIGQGRVLTDQAAARRIVRCCEGLPLALRITGAKLDTLRHVRLADYADRLCGAPSLLDEMEVGELALRARYEAFWRGLPQPLRVAYRRLAVLAPPFRYDQVVAEIEALHECSLLQPPAGEVSAHFATYGMSLFAREFGVRVAAPAPPGSRPPAGGVASTGPAA